MGLRNTLLIRAFGRPEGLIGWIGGRLMTRGKAECGRSLIDMLDLQSESSVLEIGCGPGVLLSLFAEAIPRGRVVGVDPSPTMLHQARRRNPDTVNRGQIELLLGEAECRRNAQFHAALERYWTRSARMSPGTASLWADLHRLHT